jgi:ABC-type sugar transport system ATPase subunit
MSFVATDSPSHGDVVVEVSGLSKSFGAIQALRGVNLAVRSGEIHGLVGANGAGKSTLVNILAGRVQPDSGEIRVRGHVERIRDTHEATLRGLSFIHQELNLVPKFTALQNMGLGRWPSGPVGLVDWKRLRRRAEAVAAQLNFEFSLDAPAESLSVTERWLVSIGRALMTEASVIAMDEPTAALSKQESDLILRVARDLSSRNLAVLYISHRLDEIQALCHRVTVFKDGLVSDHFERSDVTREALVKAMIGSDAPAASRRPRVPASSPIVSLRGVARSPRVHGVDLDLYPGEVLGLAGLIGSGRTELARIIFGADQRDAGEMLLDGRPVRFRGPYEAIKAGIVLVPEERRSQGLLMNKSVAWNIGLPSWGAFVYGRFVPLINRRALNVAASDIAARLQVKTPTVGHAVNYLSGGNQQKVVIAKWVARHPRVLILDEPTRGVDVGAKAEIYSLIRRMADDGLAVLVISSDLEEMSECDRVVALVEGRVSGQLLGSAISEAAILSLCYPSENAS